MLTILRKTIGHVDPLDKSKRKERAWISQKLFRVCTSLSGRAVSSAIESLILKGLIEVTDREGNVLCQKQKRQGASRLFFASRLRLVPNPKQTNISECQKRVNTGHTIKLNNETKSCYNSSQGVKRLSDMQRYHQIMEQENTRNQRIKD